MLTTLYDPSPLNSHGPSFVWFTPRDSRFNILVTIALIAVAIGSVRRVRGVTGVTSVVAGCTNAQVLGIAISRVAEVRITRSGGRSVGRISVATIVGGPSIRVFNVAVKRATRHARLTNVVGGPGVHVVNVAVWRAAGHARLTDIARGPSVQITDKIRAKPTTPS